MFCSRICTDAARKKPKQPCEHCGGPTHHWKHRFCSLTCKSAVLTIPPVERFWAKVDKDGPVHPVLGTRCWLWTGSRTPSGYGQFLLHTKRRLGRGLMIASRVAYEFSTGQAPPKDLDVCHRCDNPPCVRPDHLFLDTRLANVHDMIQKRRDRKAVGEQASAAKLTADEVRAIRTEFSAGGITTTALARRFHVSQNSVRAVVNRLTWTHIE